MKRLLTGLAIATATLSASAAPMTMIADHSAGWQYHRIGADLWPAWSTVNYVTYQANAGSSPWLMGQAGFGNGAGDATPWAANTDLALRHYFNFSGTAADLLLNVAVDNGFAAFLNGTQIGKSNAEGYTSYWEYAINVAPSLLVQGLNVLEVLAEDHGGLTYFDLKLSSSNVTANGVPVPATLSLVALGLLGAFRFTPRGGAGKAA